MKFSVFFIFFLVSCGAIDQTRLKSTPTPDDDLPTEQIGTEPIATPQTDLPKIASVVKTEQPIVEVAVATVENEPEVRREGWL